MLKHLIATAKNRPVQFIHTCRNADVLAFGARLHKAAGDNPQLTVHIYHDAAPVAEFGVIGSLDLGELGAAVSFVLDDGADRARRAGRDGLDLFPVRHFA